MGLGVLQCGEGEKTMEVKYELTEKQKRYLPIKRALDIVIAGGASVVLLPVMGIIALAIKLDSPGPILFKQKRVGKDKEIFEIWKFRTMYIDTPKDIPTHLLNNPEKYITRIGRFLRKFSLDELPQLWQVVNSTLTLIGPRPALWNQDDLIAERDKYGVNSVKPGLTGWAQINGRDELEIPVKARFDGEYVRNLGFKRDLMCFLGTIGSVLSMDGVVEGRIGAMEESEALDQCEEKENTERFSGTYEHKDIKNNIMIGAMVVAIVSIIGIWILTASGKHLGRRSKLKHLSSAAVGSVAGIATGVTACMKTHPEKGGRMEA